MHTPDNHLGQVRSVLRLGLPMGLLQIVRMLGAFVAAFMVAKLGAETLAANALGDTMFVLTVLLCSGALMAVSVLVGKSFGAKDKTEVGLITANGMWLATIISVPVTILLYLAGPIFLLLGQDPIIVAKIQSFCDAIAWAMWPYLVSFVLQQFLIGISRPKILNVFAIINLLMVVGIMYVLIYGRFGMPALGLAGVGYAYAISGIVSLAMYSIYIVFTKGVSDYNVFYHIRHFRLDIIKNIMRVGVPVGVTMSLEVSAMLVIVAMIGVLDKNALAAYQIVMQLATLAIMMPIGIGQGAGVLISQYSGSGATDRIRRCGYLALMIALVPTILLSICYFIFPNFIIRGFTGQEANPMTYQFALSMLGITAISQLFDCARMVFTAALRGLRDVKVPLFITICCFWLLGMPIAAFLGFYCGLGPIGMWEGFAVMLIITTIALGWRYKQMTAPSSLQSVDLPRNIVV